MIKTKQLAVLQYLFFALMIAVNALANILPINGLNTGEVSGLFPNLFVPAGFTFSIWGIIYLLLALYVIVSGKILWQVKNVTIEQYQIIAQLFLLTCILNASWIFLWHYLQVLFSLFIMLLFLFTLVIIYIKQQSLELTGWQKFCLQVPFIIYLAWICVATIANTTAALVFFKFDGFGLEAYLFSCVMIVVATLLALYFLLKEKQWAFGAVIAWAFYGIMVGQQTNSIWVYWFAKVAAGFVLGVTFLTVVNRKKI